MQVKKAFASCVDQLMERISESGKTKIYDEGKIGQFATKEEQENIQSFAKDMFELSTSFKMINKER